MKQKRKGYTPSQNIIIFGIILIISFAFISVPMYKIAKQNATIANLKVIDFLLSNASNEYATTTADLPNIYDTTLSPTEFAQKYFTPYLTVKKTCEKAQTECWNKPTYKDLANRNINLEIPYSIKLQNKTILGFYKNKNDEINLIIDLDGKVGANRLGKDIFIYSIYNEQYNHSKCTTQPTPIKNGLHAGGVDNCGTPHNAHNYIELFSDKLADGCNKKAPFNELGAGAACAALIKTSNWRIDKVYPW
jgi:hypothetical protein